MPDAHTFASPGDALRGAVAHLGSQGALARLVGVAQPSVWRWLQRGKSLPAEHVLIVEKATGISKHQLRPDLYPPTHSQRRGTTTMVDRGQHQLFTADAEQ